MSSSKSSTSQATNQLDNRRVIGENGISAENSALSITNNTTSLDGQTIAAALAAMQANGEQVLNFGGQLSGDAFNVLGRNGAQAFDFGGQALAESLGFGGDALTAAMDASGDALAFADSNASRNSAMAYSVFSDALGTSEGALSKAFTFGANALDRSFSGLTNTQNLVADAYSDAKGRGALTDKILIGAIAAMAVVAFAAVGKK